PVERLSVLRLDGDMYSSTIETLEALYPRVAPGGFVIVDDYILAACRQAVDDFRAQGRITEQLEDVDGAAAYWRKG
ncbi:MAG: TylF/MycF/NovP-related O-methyltransferase, partial [Microvirga sp.]